FPAEVPLYRCCTHLGPCLADRRRLRPIGCTRFVGTLWPRLCQSVLVIRCGWHTGSPEHQPCIGNSQLAKLLKISQHQPCGTRRKAFLLALHVAQSISRHLLCPFSLDFSCSKRRNSADISVPHPCNQTSWEYSDTALGKQEVTYGMLTLSLALIVTRSFSG